MRTPRRRYVHRTRQRRPTEASNKLLAARHRARLLLRHVAAGLKVHPRTVKRWEIGETRPSKSEWQRIVAYFASFLPREDTLELARVAGVDSPFASPPPVDVRAIESAIVRAADTLDVSPRRVRAALRDIAQAVANARGSLADLAKVVAEEEAAGEALRIIP